MINPLLVPFDTVFELPPFDQISDDSFAPAFDSAMEKSRANIQAIADNPDAPTFANTIDALEQADELLDRVLSVFYNVAGADSTPKREELQRIFSPKLAAYSSEISMNEALFSRVETLWKDRDALDLSDEQARVLMLHRRGFVRAGALLQGDKRERLKVVLERLAVLGTSFSQNLLADERDWYMALGPDDLDGLPDFVLDAAKSAAEEMGIEGHVVTLSRSLITPFLQFSSRRDLRQKAYDAFVSRGANGGATDNRDIAAETLALREERANVLGYEDFASFKLETEMAKTPKAVRGLLMEVWEPAKAAANVDAEILARMMHDDGINGELEAWDWRYYSEKRRAIEHDLDEAELKPYLQLDRMIEAAFDCANRLFGLEFTPLELPLYHADARAWEVTRGGAHVAVFIGDYFARGSKRSGAWCSAMRSQNKLTKDVRPIVVNVCNFAKGDPALLSFDDARTLFHEFGHALHGLMSDVTYPIISGTNVARDYVELPSQLFEHWLSAPEILKRFALHHKTGEAMPEDLLARLQAAENFNQGFATVEFVASALVDMDLHLKDNFDEFGIEAEEARLLDEINLPSAIAMRHRSPHFAHIFAGDGYAAGYYSYMWSEVMDADAFTAFEEAGDVFDGDVAEKLGREIYSSGALNKPADAYVAFRGRNPSIEPLLRKRGLVPAE